VTNSYELDLHLARARHRRLMAGVVALCLAVVVGVAAVLAVTKGTRIRIEPPDAAAVGFVKVIDGLALAVDQVIYSLSGEPTVTVGAKGFHPQALKITAVQRGAPITVTLTEKPVTLVIETKPAQPDTRFILDDLAPTIGERLEITLAPGSHVLEINNPYFQKDRLELMLERAEERRQTIALQPIAGKLRIASEPAGAAVTLKSKTVGRTPVDLDLPGGAHDVTISKEGYADLSDRILIRNDRPEAARNYILQPETATLAFSVVHKGGVLLLDGKEIDRSKSRAVSANTAHQITFALPGFIPETQIVTLKAGEIRQLRFELAPDLGKVDIRVDPPGQIFIDGRKVGESSAQLSLPSHAHHLLVSKPGYRAVQKKVVPTGAHKTVLNIVLETELAARLREAPKTYVNKAEIELTLFEPGSVVMGAPRHEPGQRANEIVREVYLRKPFYAARREVSAAQFARFKGTSSGTTLPATSMTWLEAAAFCNWLSLQEGLPLFYSIKDGALKSVSRTAEGYRLLTEAEWEWLARRAGKPTQTSFTWGDETVIPPRSGNIADESANGLTRYYVPNYNDGQKTLAPVGSYPPEPSGLFDQTGNVSEWVHDFYSLLPPENGSVPVDPIGPDSGTVHVVKGSNWRSGTRTTLRASYREGLTGSRDDVGFRIGRYLYGQDIIAKN
tara:strand:+ start:7140 stop:9158 length:2019 start_codon:yes stop_codon:yes gene_type:complete